MAVDTKVRTSFKDGYSMLIVSCLVSQFGDDSIFGGHLIGIYMCSIYILKLYGKLDSFEILRHL